MASFDTSRIRFLALVLFITICGQALAFQSSNQNSDQGYPVSIEGHTLLYIHEGLGTFNAEERAERGSQLLHVLVFSGQDVNKITTTEEPWGTEIVLGDQILMVITDQEALHTGLPRQILAKQYSGRIRDLVKQVREEHSARSIWMGVLYAVITAVIFAALIWGVIAGVSRLLRRLKSPVTHLKGIKIQQAEILGSARIARMLATAFQLIRIVLVFTLVYLLLAKEFSYFPWTREHSQTLLSYVTYPVSYIGSALLHYLPNLVYIVIIAIVMIYVLRFVRFVADQIGDGNISIPGFYPEWVQPTYKIVRLLLYAFTLVLVFPYLPGSQSPAFKGISLFLGVLFSLGSTSAISNVVAGTLLIYTRGYTVGDWVQIGDNLGAVVNQSLLATHIRTIKNEEVTIPSSVVLGTHVINYSRMAHGDGLILHTSVTIGYDEPWRKIHELLITAAKKTRYILPAPEPFVLQNSLQNSYVDYMINAYTDRPLEMVNIYSELHANIQDVFFAVGVEILSPVFSALRDGNRSALPAEFLPNDYRARGFRIEKDDASAAATGKG